VTNDIRRAFLYSNGTMESIGGLGGSQSEGHAINEMGAIVGYSLLAGDTVTHAFVWREGVMTDIGTLGGSNSFAYGVNDAGDIVGESMLPAGATHAFVYESGAMTDLNLLLAPQYSGWVLEHAFGINESGWITGYGVAPDGTEHGFILTPEPGTILVLAAGGMMLRRVKSEKRKVKSGRAR
jgi:probable HAF family extracellular repeat protein